MVAAVSEREHSVHFYESAPMLAAQVAEYLREALDANGAAVVVARRYHLDAITAELRTIVDVDALLARNALELLDAEEALAAFMDGDRIDGERFAATIGTRVATAASRAPCLRVYGVVDVLWVTGKTDAVFDLEARWSELLAQHSFSLLCGYHLGGFECRADAYETVACLHDTLHPTVALRHLERRARALQSEVTRRTRVERMMTELLELTGELAQATSREEIARLTIENASRTLGAVGAAAWTLTADGTELELLAASTPGQDIAATHYPRIPFDSDTPIAQAARTGEAFFLGTLAEYASRFPASRVRLEKVRTAEQTGFAIVPLTGRTTMGAICFSYDRENVFDESVRNFTLLVARHCALALLRVQFGERERAQREAAEQAAAAEKHARFLADEAARAREEILSVVSHDLRNPLGSILMAASTLLNVDFGDRTQRVRLTAERIHRQAGRMTRLIEDLVDFAGIQAGALSLERKHHEPSEILATTTDIFGPIAQERGLRLDTELLPNLPAIECDCDRAVQVLSNLVSNALRVTPKGGAISIGACEAIPRGHVVFYVRDTGPGIEPEELPNLFERYWRGKQTSYKGAGLGLSIARGIVDAHGGRIWAESQVGVGSTFYFSLS